MIRYRERDLKILNIAYDQRALRIEHLKPSLFSKRNDRGMRRSLGRLESAGLIERYDLFNHGVRKFLRLTPHGIQCVAETRPPSQRIPQDRKIDLNTLEHEVCVTSVRFRFESLWDGQWFPEALLKADEFPQIPDGLWVFPNGKRVAVELERSDKGVTRFHDLLARWQDVEIRLLLYVTVGDEMAECVRRYIQTGGEDLPCGQVSFEELESGKPLVWTRLRSINVFNRRTF